MASIQPESRKTRRHNPGVSHMLGTPEQGTAPQTWHGVAYHVAVETMRSVCARKCWPFRLDKRMHG